MKSVLVWLLVVLSVANILFLSYITWILVVDIGADLPLIFFLLTLGLLFSVIVILYVLKRMRHGARQNVYQPYKHGYMGALRTASVSTKGVAQHRSEKYDTYEQPSAIYPETPLQEQN